jgi:hypothetical protein
MAITKKKVRAAALSKHHNTKSTARAVKQNRIWVVDDGIEKLSMSDRPITNEYLNAMSHELIEWACNDDEPVYTIRKFFRDRRHARESIRTWLKRYEPFRVAYEFALEAIGDRRELGGLGVLPKKLDTAIVLRSMHNYLDEWKDIDRWHASLKEESNKPTTLNIIVDPIEKVIEANGCRNNNQAESVQAEKLSETDSGCTDKQEL